MRFDLSSSIRFNFEQGSSAIESPELPVYNVVVNLALGVTSPGGGDDVSLCRHTSKPRKMLYQQMSSPSERIPEGA